MWYWFRPRFRGSAPITREAFWYGIKIVILPMAILCLILKLVLVFVYGQPVVSQGTTAGIEGIHLSPVGWYWVSSPVLWWILFRAWMRRQNRGRHGVRNRWTNEPEPPGRFMTYR
jgi:hypothetical protein